MEFMDTPSCMAVIHNFPATISGRPDMADTTCSPEISKMILAFLILIIRFLAPVCKRCNPRGMPFQSDIGIPLLPYPLRHVST